MNEFANAIVIGLAVVLVVGTVGVCCLGAILDGKTQRRADALRRAEAGVRVTPASRVSDYSAQVTFTQPSESVQ